MVFFFGQGRMGGWGNVFVFSCVFPSSAFCLGKWIEGNVKGELPISEVNGFVGDGESEESEEFLFSFLFSFFFLLIYLLILPGCPSSAFYSIYISCFLFLCVLFLFSFPVSSE